jgi:two-component system, LytTR family, response regulator
MNNVTLHCIIVEDEPLARERARDFVAKLPFLHLGGTFDNTTDALAWIKSQPVDLIFLDINLGTTSGITLLEQAHITAQVVFTTAYHEYALQGYDLKITDYLLKPYTFERFVQAVDRVLELREKSAAPSFPDRGFIFVKTEYRLEKITLSEILFIEGMSDYLRIHTKDKRIMTLATFAELEKELPSHLFCRVHKSYVVALSAIETIEKDRIKIKDTLIPISDGYKKAFYAKL